ncbi:ParB N-terminal domain-containing protein [Tropicibacter sp. R16_0]|uniref:ParB/RepB/Spo0J family partition protein n=1 Tax=Tropicibacter sp. R16_0 TaxID=2821102 RepID=UPI001ADA8A88|nr:ParB N-terminal domain-containing protein [Tropicibacter sp. R16_0]MBO9452913.1 ParB N-terminal domain-containing protein [Tropicibacter sp. R16_0]
MSRKRRIFDINMPEVDDIPTGKVPDRALEKRRGPMATAISENADALRDRQSTEDAIRAENDRLAHELVRLKKEGLVTDMVALDDVVTDKLTRDRAAGPDPELDELTLSISEIGLSNPIRVERRDDGKFELIQGMRRLSAYRALLAETGDDRYAHIPAGIVAQSSTDDNYRRMVDENLVRRDISFAEMGTLARAYAEDPANECDDVDKAVAILFKSASYAKRSYIRAFASLLMRLEKLLNHPNDIPRNVGVELKRRLDGDAGLQRELSAALLAKPDRTAAEEVAILRGFTRSPEAEEGAVRAVEGKPPKSRKAKTTFQVNHPRGVAKCSASNGRMELRFDLDFTRVDRRKLEQAIAEMIDTLQES